jgi:hypothetical protein
MSGFDLDYPALLSLFDHLGLTLPPGIEADQLPGLDQGKRAKVLEEGEQELKAQGWLTIQDGKPNLEPALAEVSAVMAKPQAVIRVRHETPEANMTYSWYFVSGPGTVTRAGSQITRLAEGVPPSYHLERVPDSAAVLAQVQEVLPLQPVPESLSYRCVASEEDAEEVRSLANDWEEVPAMEIMEADGLNTAEALGLFDDMAEPQWRGRVDFMESRKGQVTATHRVLVLQGQERSWLANQPVAGVQELYVQTAVPGAFETLLKEYWQVVAG